MTSLDELLGGEIASKVPVAHLLVDYNIIGDACSIIKNLASSFLIVSDQITYNILGNRIKDILGAEEIVFEKDVKPSESIVERIRKKITKDKLVIAVGSGTINDICKYASFMEKVPYVVFGTAPSMNGYSSANASILVNGHKKSLSAHLPKAIFMDLAVLERAPIRLIKSGFGDFICRSTAQSDWLLAHLYTENTYNDTPFQLLRKFEMGLFTAAKGIARADPKAIELLTLSLLVSGFGMYLAGGSYPASQGEHMIAHTMEMVFGNNENFHGEEIGVTTLTMAQIQEDFLSKDEVSFIWEMEDDLDKKIKSFFGDKIGNECIKEYKHKIACKIKEIDWKMARKGIEKNFISSSILRKHLEDAECYTLPRHIGWSEENYAKAIKYTKYSRNRVTFLDLI